MHKCDAYRNKTPRLEMYISYTFLNVWSVINITILITDHAFNNNY